MLLATLLIWIQRRRALRAGGYSFAQLLKNVGRIEQFLREQSQLASGRFETAASRSGKFERRDLRARW